MACFLAQLSQTRITQVKRSHEDQGNKDGLQAVMVGKHHENDQEYAEASVIHGRDSIIRRTR